eukprot:jgi/Chlat1/1105/Chrsp110S01584
MCFATNFYFDRHGLALFLCQREFDFTEKPTLVEPEWDRAEVKWLPLRPDEEREELFKPKVAPLIVGPAAGFGIGCGAGFGVGLTGGLGFSSHLWGSLRLGIGFGGGCGVGMGYGYGVGKAIKLPFLRREEDDFNVRKLKGPKNMSLTYDG